MNAPSNAMFVKPNLKATLHSLALNIEKYAEKNDFRINNSTNFHYYIV